jgi:DNA polymerase III delta prime subunit
MFNALRYTQELEKAGFSRDQADVSMKVLMDVMNENFATKSDLKELEYSLRSDFAELKAEVKSDINGLKSEIKEMEYKLTIKLGVMTTISIGAMATLMKLFQSIH